MSWLLPYLLVGVGGFIGANARFLVARWLGALSGSFLLGVIGTMIAQKVLPSSDDEV